MGRVQPGPQPQARAQARTFKPEPGPPENASDGPARVFGLARARTVLRPQSAVIVESRKLVTSYQCEPSETALTGETFGQHIDTAAAKWGDDIGWVFQSENQQITFANYKADVRFAGIYIPESFKILKYYEMLCSLIPELKESSPGQLNSKK
ncbi:hypothetical protein HPB51_029459 [Rhipicephalus microplus]|uniref:Uncharacterized protein n=1 Tax=Rhipicephalus microplus TaxID=6941 RepID=A0A9J6CUW5_RHIMP|nr:hypothetical protein HPB51_029459 [Rhipicephalus microplus]